MNKARADLYTNKDLREAPAYGLWEAAHYLRIPMATLRSWVAGRFYPTRGAKKFFQPIISVPSRNPVLLSFMNLVEAHVLSAIRRKHKIPLPKVRKALEYLKKRFPSNHPLADQKFETNGLDLFIEKYGRLINITQDGQLVLKEVLKNYLRRIERDEKGLALRLYPFTRTDQPNELRSVVIDPYVGFGRPVLVGTGIPTAIIAGRYKAGESIDNLAEDYGRQRSEIEEAIRCELEAPAA